MKNKKDNKQMQELREHFVSMRKNLISSIKNANVEFDCDGDEVDVVQGNLIADMCEKLSKREVNLLKKIEAAIEKIDAGEYGYCDECEDQISEARLKAIPGCTLCISCAEEAERLART